MKRIFAVLMLASLFSMSTAIAGDLPGAEATAEKYIELIRKGDQVNIEKVLWLGGSKENHEEARSITIPNLPWVNEKTTISLAEIYQHKDWAIAAVKYTQDSFITEADGTKTPKHHAWLFSEYLRYDGTQWQIVPSPIRNRPYTIALMQCEQFKTLKQWWRDNIKRMNTKYIDEK